MIPTKDCGKKTAFTEETDRDYLCGWFSVRPKALQIFRNAKWALLFLCLGSILEGLVVNGIVNVVLSTLEKRFNLSSRESGLIRATNSISQMIATFPISYFGGKGSKPKYLGIGILSLGLGALIFTTPHFLSDVYYPSETTEGLDFVRLCKSQWNKSSGFESRNKESHNHLKYLFFLGQILHGIGSAPLWTIGVTYLDDNLPSKSSALYVGIFYAFAVIGPAIGFLGGGQLLKIHTDFDYIIDSPIDYNHPNWVGLWWMGFLLVGILSFVVGIILLSFPSKLPGWESIQKQKFAEAQHLEKHTFIKPDKTLTKSQNIFHRILKPLWTEIKILSTNYTYLCICFNQTTEGLVFAVFSAFMPKFLESQFLLSASDAAFYVGIIVVFLGSFAMVMGGWIVKQYSLGCKAILLLITFTSLLQLPQIMAFLFMRCDDGLFAGIDYPVQYKPEHIPSLSENCNANCNCGDKFDPVCGSNNVLYFSACHAGCKDEKKGTDHTYYTECSCIQNITFGNISKAENGFAKVGRCDRDPFCNQKQLYPFLFLFATIIFPMLSATAPAMQATLRCVPARLTSIAIGIQLVMSRSLGAVPGPPIFGSIVDSVCLISQTTAQDEENACAIYDQKNLGLLMFFIAVTWKFFSFLFIFAAWFFYRSLLIRNQIQQNEKDNEEKTDQTYEERSDYSTQL